MDVVCYIQWTMLNRRHYLAVACGLILCPVIRGFCSISIGLWRAQSYLRPA